jgi:hypothetical protein
MTAALLPVLRSLDRLDRAAGAGAGHGFVTGERIPAITVRRVTMTPGRASELLSGNPPDHRSRLDPGRVRVLQDVIERGEWVFNASSSDPVKVSAAGVLIDGQHRLTACVAAGRPAEMLLATGVPEVHQIVRELLERGGS